MVRRVRSGEASGVVVNREVPDAARPLEVGAVHVEQLKVAPGDVVEDVVTYHDARGLLARAQVVGAADVDAARRLPEDVFPERHVLDGAPGALSGRAAHREQDGVRLR